MFARAARAGFLTAVLAGSLVFAAWGITSLALDRDVVADRAVTDGVAPVMLVVAILVAGVGGGVEWARTTRTGRVSWAGALLWGIAAWIAHALAGVVAAGAGGVPAEVATPLTFAWGQSVSPFGAAVPVAVAACVAGAAVLARRPPGPGAGSA